MTKIKLTTSIFLFSLALLALLPVKIAFSDDQQLMTDDGREVMLRDDGTWEFRSDDRFANTKDGRRVRLKSDGSWTYIGNAPLSSIMQVRTTDLDVLLQHAVTEIHEKRVQKNKRVKTQTVFYLKLVLSAQAEKNISLDTTDVSMISVVDDKGREYPVLSIQPVPVILKPGSDATVTIRVDGSPQWWKSIHSMNIVLNSGIFGLQESMTLSQNVEDIEKKQVGGFD
ncbi:MAG: hypothetical protein KJO91_01840 [Gammaproteobacteria bacterium]|nr:hypothetical protein [Gammaproteobacteria bacterium]